MKVRRYWPVFCDTWGVVKQSTNKQLDRGERIAFTCGRYITQEKDPEYSLCRRMVWAPDGKEIQLLPGIKPRSSSPQPVNRFYDPTSHLQLIW
jgi:hypothetical protein